MADGLGGLLGRRWVWLVGALALMALPMVKMLDQQPPLPDYGPMPDFALLDQGGAVLADEALRGSVVVVDFIFTACPDVCPLLTQSMSRVAEGTADAEAPVRLLSVSVDPARDTPEVLAAYARRYGADLSRWSFVTGTDEQIREALRGFAQLAEKVPSGSGKPEDYNVAHSQSFLLYDAAGTLRGIYGSQGDELARLIADARRLAESAGS